MSPENTNNSEERKLEPYHYEAIIRAEVEKRLAAEKEKTDTKSQNIVSREYPEPQAQTPTYPNTTGWPTPGTSQTGGYPVAQPYPGQPQPYQSGPLPQYQQMQAPQPFYYQPQPQPYYPPPAPVVNVVVQNTNVNQNVNRNYNGRRYYAPQKGISGANIIYFLLLGWMFGGTWALVGLCILPFNAASAQLIFRQAKFLAFLV